MTTIQSTAKESEIYGNSNKSSNCNNIVIATVHVLQFTNWKQPSTTRAQQKHLTKIQMKNNYYTYVKDISNQRIC